MAYKACIQMPRYPTRSWRNFEPPVAAMRVAPIARLRILGLDPGSRRTGFGVIDCNGPDSIHFTHGCIITRGAALADRVREIFEGVRELVLLHRPQEVAVEQVFMSRNADSALKLGQARGAVLAAVPDGLPVFEYAPRAIKLAVVGFGAAEKGQVAHMIRALLGLEGRLAADAADALAIAICHAHSRQRLELAR
jgi:crossover junction endodeoxyribonuclease RuvC